MYDQLPIILDLQEIDSEIDKLKLQRASGPIRIQEFDAELRKYKDIFDAKNAALEELQKQRREKDRKIILQQAQLQKYRSQQLTVKTNKEYTALELEISEVQDANSKIEDEIIEIMISIDGINDELEKAKKELKIQEDILNENKSKILSEIRKIDKQIAGWNNKRGNYTGKIQPALLGKYEAWRNRRGDSLVSVIERQTCGSCHLTLPLQLINEVRKGKELHTCGNCGRILYWRDEEEGMKDEG